MIKIIDFFINRYYFNSLDEYDSFQINIKEINQIKLFQEDKLICLNDNYLDIYNIYEKDFLCKMKISDENFNYFNIMKLELYKNDIFIVYTSDEFEDVTSDLRIIKFIENKEKNKYSCKEITRIPEKANNILIQDNKIICIKKGFIKIYALSRGTNLYLQTKIIIPQIINKYSFHKGFFMKEKTINIIEYQNIFIELWSFKKYKLKYESHIKLDNYISSYNLIIKSLNKEDYIIFCASNYIYFYSNNKKSIIKKIEIKDEYWEILGISLTKKGDIYINDRNSIYTLDIKNNKSFKLTRINHIFESSLIIVEKGNIKTFILHSKNKIKFFHNSVPNIIIVDLYSFSIIWFYLKFILKIFLYKYSNNEFKKISFIVAFVIHWIITKIDKNFLIKEKIENNKLLIILVIIYIIIHIYNYIISFNL